MVDTRLRKICCACMHSGFASPSTASSGHDHVWGQPQQAEFWRARQTTPPPPPGHAHIGIAVPSSFNWSSSDSWLDSFAFKWALGVKGMAGSSLFWDLNDNAPSAMSRILWTSCRPLHYAKTFPHLGIDDSRLGVGSFTDGVDLGERPTNQGRNQKCCPHSAPQILVQ